eukprot:86492-Rhodomonas_salina.2
MSPTETRLSSTICRAMISKSMANWAEQTFLHNHRHSREQFATPRCCPNSEGSVSCCSKVPITNFLRGPSKRCIPGD